MADKYQGLHKGFNSVKGGMGDKKSADYPAALPDPAGNMPKDRLAYHRNPKVKVAPDTASNRMWGNAGRAQDPEGGRPSEGGGGASLRKGQPVAASYDGSATSKARLLGERLWDTNDASFETISGKKAKGK